MRQLNTTRMYVSFEGLAVLQADELARDIMSLSGGLTLYELIQWTSLGVVSRA